jgi:carbon-monoxide dehydrogenase medium subunit
MTGVFVAQVGKSVRVAVTGAGPGVFRWSAAERALRKNMSPAALDKLKVDATDLNEDLHASREYRANLVKVMAQRAVAQLAGQ